jgi:hypothetical protein
MDVRGEDVLDVRHDQLEPELGAARVQPEGRDASGKGVPSRHLVAAREHGAERGRLGRHRRTEDADEQPSHQDKDDRTLHDSALPVARTGRAAT